jgi:predicted small secreted protein
VKLTGKLTLNLKGKKMKKLISFILFLAVLFSQLVALAGCQTMAGIGEDLSDASRGYIRQTHNRFEENGAYQGE